MKILFAIKVNRKHILLTRNCICANFGFHYFENHRSLDTEFGSSGTDLEFFNIFRFCEQMKIVFAVKIKRKHILQMRNCIWADFGFQ